MQVALYSRLYFSSMRSTSFPPVDLPVRVAARRVLCFFALLTIALY